MASTVYDYLFGQNEVRLSSQQVLAVTVFSEWVVFLEKVHIRICVL